MSHRGGTAARRSLWIACVAPVVSLSAVALVQVAGASSAPPALVVSPKGNIADGQSISVSAGANGYFTPHARLNILECADPGGSPGNLPKDDKSCDGNTIQGSTIVVGADGSFSDPQYPVYSLPSSTLGEQSNFAPVCDHSNYCVLYVGQNQNDFTAPRVFSAPFLVIAGSGTSSTSSTSSTSATTSTSGSSAPAGTTSNGSTSGLASSGSSTAAGAGSTGPVTSAASTSGALANTGLPPEAVWLVVVGMALLLTGGLGRRLLLRGRA